MKSSRRNTDDRYKTFCKQASFLAILAVILTMEWYSYQDKWMLAEQRNFIKRVSNWINDSGVFDLLNDVLSDSRMSATILTVAYCLFTRDQAFYLIVVYTAAMILNSFVKFFFRQPMYFFSRGLHSEELNFDAVCAKGMGHIGFGFPCYTILC